MRPLSHIPKPYAQFKSTTKEYLSNKGPRINLALSSPAFRIQYCYPHEMLYKTTLEYLERPWHPYKLLLQRRWDDASTTGLWKFFVCGTSVGQKAAIRRYQTRRLRHALRLALKKRGLDNEGIPLNKEAGAQAESPIKGSLLVSASIGVNEASFESLVTWFSDALEKIGKRRGANR